MRRLIRSLLGFSFFRRTNCEGSYVLAAFHHPDSITWRWCVWYDKPRSFKIALGPNYNLGTSWRSPNGDFGGWLTLGPLGQFSFSTQQPMWRK